MATFLDVQGQDDEPGQKDLTQLQTDTSDPNKLNISWNFDEPTLSGANTFDSAVLFDADGDGFVDYAFFVSLDSSGTVISGRLYDATASDDRRANVDNGSPYTEYVDTSDPNYVNDPDVSVTSALGTDPFPDNGGSQYTANDRTVSVCIPTSIHTITGTTDLSGTEVLNVCSYPSSSPTSDESDCIFEVDPPAPDPILNISKTANVTEVDAADDEIIYTYEVTNTVDGSEATNVTVEDDNATPGDGTDDFNPTFIGGDTDGDGNLDFGEIWTYQETVSVTQAQMDSGADIVNVATADSTETGPVTDDATVMVIQTPLLSIDKEVVDTDNDGLLWNDTNGNDLPDEGETIDYKVTVSNDGNITLTNVEVDDPIAGIDSTIPTLAVDASEMFTGSYIITQADIDAGERVNTATADSDETDPVDDTETVTLPQDREIDLVKDVELTIDSDLSEDTSAGDTLTYTFTIENTGNVTLTDVTLEDPLPGLSAIDFGTFDGTLAPGDKVEGTATYTVTPEDVEAGDIENTATVVAEAPGGDPDDPSDDVTDTDTETVNLPQPDLAVQKDLVGNADEDGSGDVSVGDTLSYTITATNTGTANLTDVTVSDNLTGDSTTEVGPVLPGDTVVLNTTYVVTEANVTNGFIENIGTADSDQTGPEEDTENVPVPFPELDIDKTFTDFVDNDGNGEVTQGDILNYDITVESIGTANLTNVEVTDALTGLDETIPFLAAGAEQTFERMRGSPHPQP